MSLYSFISLHLRFLSSVNQRMRSCGLFFIFEQKGSMNYVKLLMAKSPWLYLTSWAYEKEKLP